MKQVFSQRFGSFFIVFLRVGAALLLLASVIALPATPVRALSFPAEINKSFTPPAITSGGISTLRVTVYNPNSFPLTQTAWTDNFPLGITISSPLTVTNTCGGSVGAVVGGATLSLSNGTVPLQVGATPGQCYVEVAVTSTTSGNLINTIPASAVTAKGDDGGTIVDITNTTPASATLNVVGVTPPTLAKSFAPNTMYVGGTSVLTVTIKNNDASAQLTETTLTDYLPAGLTLGTPVNAAAPTNCGTGSVTGNPGDTQYTLTNASILAGATCTIQINITSAVQGAYTNTIPAGPGGLGSIHTRQGVTNASPATANLNVQAFTMTKAFAPASIPAGNTSTLTITIRNRANFAYNNVSLYDDLYPYVGNNLEFVGGTATFAACGAMSAAVTNTGLPSTVNNRATFSGGSIAAGATCTITISVRAFQNTPAAAYTNTIPVGRITTTEGATNDALISTNLTVTNPLSITKNFAAATIALGSTTTLTINIFNTSSQPYHITNPGPGLPGLTDNLAAPTDSYLSIAATPNASTTCAGGVVTTGARTVTITGGTIPAASSCTITVDVVGSTVGANRTNRIPAGALGTTEGLSNPANANANISITSVNPTVGKAFSSAVFGANNIVPGGTVTLTITITNPVGATALTGIHLVDNLNGPPTDTKSVIAAVPAASTDCTGATLTATPGTQLIDLTGGSLLGGSPAHSCTITVPVTLPMGTYGSSVINTIPMTNFTDDQGIGITANTTRTLNIRAVDVLSKTFTPATIATGGTSSLVITLQNFTGSPLTVNTLTDTLPAQLSVAAYPPATAPSTTCVGGAITAVAGTQAISMTGGTIPAAVAPNYTNYGSCIVTIPVTSTTVGGPYTNTIPSGVLGLTTFEGPVSVNPRSATLTVIAANSPATLTKTYGSNPVAAGVNSLMTLTINAPADMSLTSFSITDTFPTNMVVGNPTGASVVSGCGAGAFVPAVVAGAGSITVTGATINPGTPCIIRVNVTGNLGGSYINTIHPADITNLQGRTIAANVTQTLNVTTVSTLTVTKSFQSTAVNVNGLSTLTIYLDNSNLSTLTNASLTDTLPGTAVDGVRVAPTPNASTTCGAGVITAVAGSGTISMANGTIPARVGATDGLCSIKVDVQGKRTAAALPITYTNTIPTASVTATNQDTLEVMNSTAPASGTLTITTLTMEVVKKFDPTLVYGGSVSQLSVTLRNPNPSAALTGIAFTDTMPQDPLFPGDLTKGMIIATPANFNAGTCGGTLTGTPGTRTFTYSGGMLPAATECTLTLEATMTVNGNLTNTIPIGAVTTFNGVSNTTATSASLTNLAGASLSKAFSPAVIAAGPGNISTLTITIKNTTSLVLTGVGLVDTLPGVLPAGLMIAPAPAPVNNCGGTLTANAGSQNIQLVGGTLTGNSSCTLVVPVTSNTPGVYTNTIPASTLTTNEGASNHEPAVDTLTVTGYSLGNRVWYDTNNNGLLDGAEVGVSGVRVELYQDNGTTPGVWDTTDTFIGFATTDIGGYYRFDGLAAGDYVVKIPAVNFASGPLAGYWSSGTSIAANGTVSDSIGPSPSNNIDSDDNGVTTFTGNTVNYISAQAVALGPGANAPTNDNDPVTNPQAGEAPNNQSNRTVDFGFYRVELGNQIFADVNSNGSYDAGETTLSGATVGLYASNGTTLIATTTTAAGGTYLFSGLAAGDYIVKVTPPAGYQSTVDTANSGDTTNPNNNIDNNDNGVGTGAGQVSSNAVTLTPGSAGAASNNVVSNATGTTTNPTLDFGFHTLIYSLGNRVWFDTNNNGLLDVAEAGVSGVRVELYQDDGGTPGIWDAGDTFVGFATTDASGYYRFDNLAAGDYVVKIPAVNFVSGPLVNYWSSGTSIAANGVVSDSIGPSPSNNVDSDDNGVTTFTGNTVNYISSQAVTLGPGTSEPTNDNDPATNPQAGEAPNNQSNRTVDFGFYRVELSNQIFTDVNGNGTYDAGDTTLSGATVGLYASNGTTLITTTTTAAGGTYLFSGLAAGDYIVKVTPPAGYQSTVDTANSGDTTNPNNNIDNNDNGIGAGSGQVSSNTVTLTPGSAGAASNNVVSNATGTTTNPTLDFGFVTSYSLGNRVWYDTNNNGLLDGAEAGVSGVRVELYQDNGTTPGVWDAADTFVGFATTDASGYYRFDGLPAGGYVVKIPAVNFASGPLAGYWSSGTSIAANGTVSDSIGPSPSNNVDSDDNGVTTFSGNTVNYVSAQAVTLGPGANAPTNDNDPVTNPQAGEAPNDQSNRTVDFGFYHVEVSNQIFVDVNTNGTYDAGDTTLSGATVGLYASNGTTLITTTTTAAGGTYLFSGLAAGDYIVKVTPPAGYQSTVDTANSGDTANPNNNIDNNDNGIGVGAGQVSSNAVTLTPGSAGAASNNIVNNATGTTTNPTLDFGFQRLIYSLGNRVWYDTNNDGLLNNGEVGISGVRVELYEDNGTTPGVYDSGDTFVGFQNTDLNGYYRFDNLPSGNYVVVIPAVNFNNVGAVLAGYLSSGTSITNAGVASDSFGPNPNTDKTDSDDNGITTFSANAVNYVSTRAVTLGPGSNEPTGETDPAINPLPGEAPDNQSNRTVDFGFYRQLLSDQIFNDLNGNGSYDSGTDTGLSGAIVRLYAGNGTTEIRVGPDGILGTSDDATGGVTTGAAGTYLFSGLPAGQYIVKVLPSAGPSTVDTANPGDTANPNDNIDNNDNGVGTASGQVSSNRVTLTPGVVGVSTTVANSTGTTSNPSLDFGFVPQYSLGNRVWYDTNNDGLLNNGETGIPGVRVELYHDNGNGIYDSGDTFVSFKTTDANGYYRFDGLDAGSYVVVIPADNFRNIGAGDKVAGDPLAGYLSSGTSIAANGVVTDGIGPNPNINKADNDDNGVTTFNGNVVNYVSAAAVTLGPGVSEPTGETDPVTNPLPGEAPDNQSNRTVDFGFYRQQLGNLIYDDLNPNGTFDAGDTVLSSAVVQLYAANGTTEINVGPDGILGTADDAPGGMTIGVAGTYLFSGLPQGDYVVKVTPPASYKSAVDTANPGDTATPNNNIDNNDNGVGENIGQSASNRFTMTPGATGVSTTVINGTGTTYNPSLDFGFVASTTFQFSLGNRVWFDTNNNGLLDSNEVGVSGVRVELYLDNGSTPGAYDSGDTFKGFKTTNANGYYRFDSLAASKYVVVIPTTNFNAGPLAGYWSSGTTLASNGTISDGIGPSPDVNPADSDDNGVTTFSGQTVNYVSARTVTLGPGASEPTGDNDPVTNPEAGEAPNDQSNRTVDFGFYRVDLGNLVFNDANLNGTYDAGDTPLPGAVVQLYASNSSTEINVGPDGILGTADDAPGGVTTLAGGTYLFSNLPAGNYIVKVTPPAGNESTIDTAKPADTANPNSNVDNNDNGAGTSSGQVSSNPVTLTPGNPGATNSNIITQNTATTFNPTLDFGFAPFNGLNKTLINTSETFTTGNDATIGEILTYEITFDLKSGVALNNVTVTDRMQKGLAFVDCLSVNVAGTDVTGTVCPPTVSDFADPGDAGNPANPGRQAVFNIGNISAPSSDTTLVIQYRVIVLDVLENQDGVTLTNNATISYDGSTPITKSAPPVKVVEPKMVINKSAIPNVGVPLGAPVQFTLVINHTSPQSTADAFDVVVKDVLPAELEFIPCSVTYSGWTPTDPLDPAYCIGATTATKDLTFRWDTFPRGQVATINFSARLVGTPATNSASLEWTSLPIDPGITGLPVQLSAHNPRSTERWYDPKDHVNAYGTQSSVTINAPEGSNSGGGGGEGKSASTKKLPATGFAPGIVSDVPVQPSALAYKSYSDLKIEIPSLNVNVGIVGVPSVDDQWDITWLGANAGYLSGTAFPSWLGNSVITGHVYMANGLPGPFVNLSRLKWGDQIVIHAFGQKYIYEVRSVLTVSPDNTAVLGHKDQAWVTLLTCKEFDATTGAYKLRTAVQAVLVAVVDDVSGAHSGR